MDNPIGKENKANSNKYADINKQFEDLDLGDNDFDDDFEEEEDSNNFDANELLNFNNYQNKRK